jgi:sulfide:quinone oxidoreductase
VDRNTLQHTRYANVFGLGDCTSTPNAKTAAAARAQFPVVSANLLSVMDSRHQPGSYDGYGGCPLTVEKGKVMLAEFRYDGEIVPSFNADPRVPRRFYWVLKERIFPFVYWYGMLRGRDWKYPTPKLRPAVTTDLE